MFKKDQLWLYQGLYAGLFLYLKSLHTAKKKSAWLQLFIYPTNIRVVSIFSSIGKKYLFQTQMKWHHFMILKRYRLFSFNSFIKFSFIKLIFKCANKLAPAVFCLYVTKMNINRIATRRSANGNRWVAQCKIAFGQSSFSQKGIDFLNAALPIG